MSAAAQVPIASQELPAQQPKSLQIGLSLSGPIYKYRGEAFPRPPPFERSAEDFSPHSPRPHSSISRSPLPAAQICRHKRTAASSEHLAGLSDPSQGSFGLDGLLPPPPVHPHFCGHRVLRPPRAPAETPGPAGLRSWSPWASRSQAAPWLHGPALRRRDPPALLPGPQRLPLLQAEAVRRDLQDAPPRLPVRDAGEPGGGALRAGVAGAPLQTDVPAEQGAPHRPVGALLPPGRLPPPPPQARPGPARPGGPAQARAGHRGCRALHPRGLGGRRRRQHFPRHEEALVRRRHRDDLRRAAGRAAEGGAPAELRRRGERLQLLPQQLPRDAILQGDPGEAAAERRAERRRARAEGAGRAGRQPARLPHAVAGRRRRRPRRGRAADGRAGRRQRHRRAVRGAGHDGQRAHLDGQVPPRPAEAARGRQGGARGDPRGQRRREAAADMGADEEHDADAQGDFGEPKDGEHHLLHVQGGRGRRGVQRVSYPQGVEGDAALQEHPSQPGLLPGSTEVRPFAIQGGAAAEHLHAVRERGARVPGERAGQARDAGAHHHLVTGYRWEVVGSSDDVEYSPFPVPRHGLLARLRRDDGVCAGRKGCPTDEDDNYDDDEVIV